MKAKRTGKSKTSPRRAKSAILRPKKKAAVAAKSKKALISRKKTVKAKKAVESQLQMSARPTENLEISQHISPYAALNDERALATAWEILGDEEYVLDEEIWNSLYNRIKLQLLRVGYSFRVAEEGFGLSPYAVTPMPAFRGDHEPGFLHTGNFTVLCPELPGVVFDLKLNSGEQALLLDWSLKRTDALPSTGHIALYCDGELVEAVNLMQNRCQLEITRDDLGDISFYFLDADTGKQTKILELSI